MGVVGHPTKPDLSRLRFPVEASRGRRYPEPPHPYRNEFQRDRGRIVHARAFRRLENKTQVFNPGLHDHFRNRLTHTIEVSQIARTTAVALKLNEDLTEVLALAHDIGHPPFAHSGEAELNRQMGRYGEKFDHNLHALRLVESFEQRYARFPGLNLTFEVREGMVKHSRDISDEDREVLREYLPDCRPPLEGQLIDLADEIAYNTADLDDAYSAGMFSIEDVTAAVPQYGEIRAEIERAYPEASERLIFQEILRRLIDWLVSGLVEGTRDAAERASVGSFDDVRRHGVRLACIEGPAMETNLALKTFLRHNVYYSRPLVEEREAAARQIGELFQYYADQPDRLPEGYREQAHETPVHRVICDYIAGMTDGYFKRTYAQVMGD